MGKSITFAGPDFDYTITLPDDPPFEDKGLIVSGPDGQRIWPVDVEDTGNDGIVELQGLTRGAFSGFIVEKDALWFGLRLTPVASIGYARDGTIVRTDRERQSS